MTKRLRLTTSLPGLLFTPWRFKSATGLLRRGLVAELATKGGGVMGFSMRHTPYDEVAAIHSTHDTPPDNRLLIVFQSTNNLRQTTEEIQQLDDAAAPRTHRGVCLTHHTRI